MSTKRQQQGGWAGVLPRGPNGRNLCRRCQTEVPPSRKTFCGEACVHQWLLRTNASYLRKQVFRRDRGVCALCRVNTMATVRRSRSAGTGHLWQADHIVPVIEGGGECDLDNMRTLCTACHKIATAALAARRAARLRVLAEKGAQVAVLSAEDIDEGLSTMRILNTLNHLKLPVGSFFGLTAQAKSSLPGPMICRKSSAIGFIVVGEEMYGEIQFTHDNDARIVPLEVMASMPNQGPVPAAAIAAEAVVLTPKGVVENVVVAGDQFNRIEGEGVKPVKRAKRSKKTTAKAAAKPAAKQEPARPRVRSVKRA